MQTTRNTRLLASIIVALVAVLGLGMLASANAFGAPGDSRDRVELEQQLQAAQKEYRQAVKAAETRMQRTLRSVEAQVDADVYEYAQAAEMARDAWEAAVEAGADSQQVAELEAAATSAEDQLDAARAAALTARSGQVEAARQRAAKAKASAAKAYRAAVKAAYEQAGKEVPASALVLPKPKPTPTPQPTESLPPVQEPTPEPTTGPELMPPYSPEPTKIPDPPKETQPAKPEPSSSPSTDIKLGTCPEGYVKVSNTTCRASKPANYTPPACTSGTCQAWNTCQNYACGATQVCVAWGCPSGGYYVGGNMCMVTVAPGMTYMTPASCVGYTAIPNTCTNPVCGCAVMSPEVCTPAVYSCDSGWTLEGTQCVKEAPVAW